MRNIAKLTRPWKNSAKFALLTASLLFVSASTYAASSIGVQFGGAGSSLMNIYLGPAETAGANAVAQVNWNVIHEVGGEADFNIINDISGELKDAAGNLTAVKLQYSGNDAWRLSNTAGLASNVKLLSGEVKGDPTNPDGGGGVLTLTWTGLGAGTYEVYLYGAVDGGGAEVSVTVGGTTYYWTEPGSNAGPLTEAAQSTDIGNPGTGNYMHFTGLSPDGSGTISIVCNYVSGSAGEVGITGLQLISPSAFPAGTTAPPTYAAKIGVEFSGANRGSATVLAAGETAGYIVQPDWNVVTTANGDVSEGTALYLKDNATNSTTVALQYHGDDSWSTLAGSFDTDDRLMKGYLADDGTGGSAISLILTNLGTGPYDIYLYGDILGGPSTVSVQLGATTYYWTEPPDYNGFYKQAPLSTDSGNPGVGNFLRISGVTPVSGAISITATFISGSELGIPALQLCSSSGFPLAVTTILPQPTSQAALAGRTATFVSGAVGAAPFTYQWQDNPGSGWVNVLNNSRISGATSSTLAIGNVGSADAISYRMIATDATAHSVTSSVVSLTVETAAVGVVFTGDNTSTANFVTPTVEAGALPQTNWTLINTLGGSGDITLCQGSTDFLQDNMGNWTPVHFQYSADDAWSTGPTATSNDKLMHGQLMQDPGDNGTTQMVLTFTNLGAGPYTVYLYGAVIGGPATLSLTLGGATYYWTEPASFNETFTQAANSTDSGNPGVGNYIVFNNVTPVSGTITFTNVWVSGGPNSGEFGISALQLVSASSAFPAAPLTIHPQPPASQVALAGTSATFRSGAIGLLPISYQWQKNPGSGWVNVVNDSRISGATSSTLTIGNLSSADAASYRLIASNNDGGPHSVTSSVDTLTIVSAALAVDFTGDADNAGMLATWAMASTDVAGVLGQAQWNEINNSGGGGNPLALIGTSDYLRDHLGTATQVRLAYSADDAWYCPGGEITDNNGKLMMGVLKEDNAGSMTLSFTNVGPGSYEVYLYGNEGDGAATLSVAVGANTYYWRQPQNFQGTFTEAPLSTDSGNPGAGNYLHFTGLSPDVNGLITFICAWVADGGPYSELGIAGIQLVKPSGSFPPGPVAISTGPAPSVLYAGRTVTFSVAAVSGFPPITYQWQVNSGSGWVNLVNNSRISGATSASLTIANVGAADAFSYRVIATDAGAHSVTSSATTLTIAAPPVANSYAAAVVADNPLAYYRINEAVGTTYLYDYVGDHNGYYEADATVGQAGVPNPPYLGFEAGNLSFQPSTAAQRTSFAHAPFGTLAGMSNVTFTMWIYPNVAPQAGGSAGLIVDRTGAGSGGGLMYSSDGSQLRYQWNTNTASSDIITTTFDSGLGLPASQWSFCALVISPNGANLYLYNANGLASTNDPTALVAQTFGGDWHLGNDQTDANANQTFDGLMDEVAIFGSSLSTDQINQLYLAATSGLPEGISIARSGQNVVLSWSQGVLLEAPAVTGPWTTNSAATSPYPVPANQAKQFYRLKIPVVP
jgi:hypothetical protein